MNSQMSKERVNELKETFDFYDNNSDGCLDVYDLRELFKSMGYDLCDDAIQDKINEVDYDGNGTIEF